MKRFKPVGSDDVTYEYEADTADEAIAGAVAKWNEDVHRDMPWRRGDKAQTFEAFTEVKVDAAGRHVVRVTLRAQG